MARISDNYSQIEDYADSYGSEDSYFRDFDPTLNQAFLHCPLASEFKCKTFEINGADKQDVLDESTWLNTEEDIKSSQKAELILTDDNGIQWVSLNNFTMQSSFDNSRNFKCWVYGYFIPADSIDLLKGNYKCCNHVLDDMTDIPISDGLYNREYPWSDNCLYLRKRSFSSISFKTVEKMESEMLYPDSKKNYEDVDIPFLTAAIKWNWNVQYDASKDHGISFLMPCHKLIDELGLKQLEYDGYYFDSEGKLALFDTSLTREDCGLVIRMDLLEKFLAINEMMLVWFAYGEKCSLGNYRKFKHLYVFKESNIVSVIWSTL